MYDLQILLHTYYRSKDLQVLAPTVGGEQSQTAGREGLYILPGPTFNLIVGTPNIDIRR